MRIVEGDTEAMREMMAVALMVRRAVPMADGCGRMVRAVRCRGLVLGSCYDG